MKKGSSNSGVLEFEIAIGNSNESKSKEEAAWQRGRVVSAPDLKSVGRGFKSRSDR